MQGDQPRGEYRGGQHGRGGYGPGQGGHGERRGVPLSDLDPALTETSRKVIGAAIEVHRALGPGYAVAIYRAALAGELQALAVNIEHDAQIAVAYKGKTIGTATADLLVEKKFIVTLLSRPGEIGGYERAALRAQLKAANLDLGLIINFGERRLKDGLVRVLNIDKINADKGITGHEGDFEDEPGHGGHPDPGTVSFS